MEKNCSIRQNNSLPTHRTFSTISIGDPSKKIMSAEPVMAACFNTFCRLTRFETD